MDPTRRRRPSPALVIALLALVVAVSATPVGQAAAAALNVSTVKKIAKKTANQQIKRKAKKLVVARAKNSDRLGGVPATGYLRSGPMTISLSSVGWQPIESTGLTVFRYANLTKFKSSITDDHTFVYLVTIPLDVAGAPLTLTSVRYCYTAAAGARLMGEEVTQERFETGVSNGVGAVGTALDLADSGCRTITLNRALGPHDQIVLVVVADWTTANLGFDLGLVTATVTPA